jgi:DNA-binding CsgD family transcriptional regulator
MAEFNSLSKREWEVANLLLQGKSNKLIASSLGISQRTVEFHLKNIYSKLRVNSRVELILKLGNPTGKVETEKLGYSTVDRRRKSDENGGMLNSRTNRVRSFRDTVSIIGKDLEMKNLLSTKHVLVAMITALITGFVWVTILQHFGHMSSDAVKPWILPLAVVLAVIGLSVGLAGKRNGNSLLKIGLSTLFGTGLGAFAMIPLTGLVLYPLAKFAEWLGLIDRSAISTDVTSTLVIVAMIVMWLVVGAGIGIMLLSVTSKRPEQGISQTPAAEHRS